MAAQDGEERLMIVFADVHYFFSRPRPQAHEHRFEKASYLYLFGRKDGRGARLEIANNAGTSFQDAFTGSLDTVTIRQSHKQPTLCTITVNAYHNPASSPALRARHWQLPNTDPHTEQSTLQSLHTVDIYFWTAQDADTFINGVRRLLQLDQVELLDVPTATASREKVVSPVVEQLENVAIQDSNYQSGKTTAFSEAQVSQGRQESAVSPEPASFQPMAYNPASPPAPEPIRHREKTPPPPDAETGTGLGAAAYADQAGGPSQNLNTRPAFGHVTQSQSYVPGTTSQTPSAVVPSTVPSAIRSPSSTSSSLPPPPPLSPPSQGSPSNQQALASFGGPPQQQTVAKYDPKGNPLPSPASQVMGNSYVSGNHQPLQHNQPQYADYLGSTGHQTSGPIGGYSNFSYTPKRQDSANAGDYDVHHQVYRPTESEAKVDPRHQWSENQQSGKLDQQATRVDKGVNRFFKKIEKKVG